MQRLHVDEILSPGSIALTRENIAYMSSLNTPALFNTLQPSTLTVCGQIGPISFDEEQLVDMLSQPTGNILMIGCNYGELFNPEYKSQSGTKRAGRGRKPKEKEKSMRKSQGTGKYFSSQMTFHIRNTVNNCVYKIKLFRTGTFQVPGIKNPDVSDLHEPINTLVSYLRYELGDDQIQVQSFRVSMRNYKTSLVDVNTHVDLRALEKIFRDEKTRIDYTKIFAWLLTNYSNSAREYMWGRIKNMHPIGFAELGYNPDRCFPLMLKFRRPILEDKEKKATVKLLKRGKINFDGANSQDEVELLYLYLQHIYHTHCTQVLVNIADVASDGEASDCSVESIYDSDLVIPAKTAKPKTVEVSEDAVVSLSTNTTTTTEVNEVVSTEKAMPAGDVPAGDAPTRDVSAGDAPASATTATPSKVKKVKAAKK